MTVTVDENIAVRLSMLDLMDDLYPVPIEFQKKAGRHAEAEPSVVVPFDGEDGRDGCEL